MVHMNNKQWYYMGNRQITKFRISKEEYDKLLRVYGGGKGEN